MKVNQYKAHLVMPMGGAGTRFYKDGYGIPKPLICINEKPFFYWAAKSIIDDIEICDITFVVLQEHIKKHNIDKFILQYFPNARIIALESVLPGAVHTSLVGVKQITDNNYLIVNDCDHMFKCEKLKTALQDGTDMDGGLLTFESDSPQFSYVKYGKDGEIIGTVEKNVVSNHAICGAYVFRDAELFRKMASVYIENCPYNECFMSGLYNVMCEQGLTIRDYVLDYHVDFGTPEEYNRAKESKYFKR